MTVAGEAIKGVAAGVFSAGTAAEQTRAEHVFVRRYKSVYVTDGGTAGTAQTETVIHRAEVSGKVLKAWWAPPIAITGGATNVFTSVVGKRTGAGARTQIGIISSDTDLAYGASDVAFVPRAYTLTAADVSYAAGDAITVDVTKGGTGVAIAAATSQALVELLLEEGT